MRQFIFFLEVKLGLLLPITLLGLKINSCIQCTVIIIFDLFSLQSTTLFHQFSNTNQLKIDGAAAELNEEERVS